MYKYLLILCMLFPISASAIDYRFYGQAEVSRLNGANDEKPYFSDMSKVTFGMEWGWFPMFSVETYFDTETYYYTKSINQHFPYRDVYSFGGRVNFIKFFFVQYDHRCLHPVYSGEETHGGKWTMVEDKITIGVKYELKGSL